MGFLATKYFMPGVNWNNIIKKAIKRGMDTTDPKMANERNEPECGSIIVCLSQIVISVNSAKTT